MKVMIKLFIMVLSLFSCGQNYADTQHFLSFIMPCYNCASFVKRSLDSIYQQNVKIPFEVICTDDGSADSTLMILREYEELHDNFHVYAHPHNKSGGAASNTCIAHSKGDLIFRLDSDNVLAPDTINKLVDLLDITGCDGATVQELRFFTGNFERANSWFYVAPNNICDLRHVITEGADPAHSGNYLYTRTSYNRAGGYPEQHGSDTFCFGFKQYATGSRIAVLPDSFYWHFVNTNGYWFREERSGKNHERSLAVLREFSEVFSVSTTSYLSSFQSGNPLRDIGSGKLTLASTDILNHLFAGHAHTENRQYAEAVREFEQAVLCGCKSEKIITMIAELKKNIKS